MTTGAVGLLLLLCLAASLMCVAAVSEVAALLDFKRKVLDPLGAMGDWDASTPAAPCDWSGILCEGGSVRGLQLSGQRLAGGISEDLGRLTQLRELDLHGNSLKGSIPRALSQCSQLRSVYLQGNSLGGEIPAGLLSNLTNLQVLNVSHNFISGKIPGDIPTSLQMLDLSFNSLSGEIPVHFSSSHMLQLINLSSNRLSGEIPSTIGALQQLQWLWLDDNKLDGTIPSAISSCSSLVQVTAGHNMLSGVVPATMGSLKNLQILSLPGNRLTGVVSASLLCNLSLVNATIRVLNLSFNALTGIETKDGRNCESVLEVLDLHGNQINGVFPVLLAKFPTLRVLDISGNSISGTLPDQFGNLVNLEEFKVGNNSLSGEIPRGVTQCGSLRVLDLGNNRFSGSLPEFFGAMKSLKMLILGDNLLSGVLPASIGSLYSLEVLDLGNNGFNGTVPLELLGLSNLSTLNLSNNRFSDQILLNIGEMKGLQTLNMSGCGFSGQIPSGIGNLLKLKTLDLSRQNLSGELPIELFGLPNLQVVALEMNSLSGALPEGFSSLSSLQHLHLSYNGFTGQLPATYGFLRSMALLSLSHNRLTGLIPSDLSNCSSLEVLEIRGNELQGPIPAGFSKLSRLQTLDLGQNTLTGAIPDGISDCSSLVTLLLDSNQISGKIPPKLSKLSSLNQLDLSSNNLTGGIPTSLSLLPGLQRLNLSNNNLDGQIPLSLASHFSDASYFSENANLCGRPLQRSCSRISRLRKIRLILFILAAMAGSLILLCFCGYACTLIRWRRRTFVGVEGKKRTSSSGGSQGPRGSGENEAPKLVMFNSKITYTETLEATRQFDEENVLSRGKYGLVFKATYADGMVLAIRRLPDASVPEHTFRKEAEYLGRIKHRNLTVLRGYYAGPPPDMRLLVYDYMPNGNLATLLQEASHQEGHILNWPMRHLIALGIARGLAFLHSVPIAHGDVKPHNVLFDADFEPHLSESMLDKLTLVAPNETSTSGVPTGTLGYVAPEVMLTGQATSQADVYSFGIVVLEILTGKKPLMFTQDEDIVKWVKRQLQRGQVSELLEPGLLQLDPESSEWEEFLLGVKVGLLCTMPDPSERPSMNDVVYMLEGCRLGPELQSSADPTALPSPAS